MEKLKTISADPVNSAATGPADADRMTEVHQSQVSIVVIPESATSNDAQNSIDLKSPLNVITNASPSATQPLSPKADQQSMTTDLSVVPPRSSSDIDSDTSSINQSVISPTSINSKMLSIGNSYLRPSIDSNTIASRKAKRLIGAVDDFGFFVEPDAPPEEAEEKYSPERPLYQRLHP